MLLFHCSRIIHEAFQCLIKKKKNPTVANIVHESKRNLENQWKSDLKKKPKQNCTMFQQYVGPESLTGDWFLTRFVVTCFYFLQQILVLQEVVTQIYLLLILFFVCINQNIILVLVLQFFRINNEHQNCFCIFIVNHFCKWISSQGNFCVILWSELFKYVFRWNRREV